jgi:hypothetical protein
MDERRPPVTSHTAPSREPNGIPKSGRSAASGSSDEATDESVGSLSRSTVDKSDRRPSRPAEAAEEGGGALVLGRFSQYQRERERVALRGVDHREAV